MYLPFAHAVMAGGNREWVQASTCSPNTPVNLEAGLTGEFHTDTVRALMGTLLFFL